jgi:hypothetical protein
MEGREQCVLSITIRLLLFYAVGDIASVSSSPSMTARLRSVVPSHNAGDSERDIVAMEKMLTRYVNVLAIPTHPRYGGTGVAIPSTCHS